MKIIAVLLLSFVAVSKAVVDIAPAYDPQIVDSFDLGGGDYDDNYRQLLDGNHNCWYLRFKVKSDNAVFVQFSSTNGESEESYEVMIGAWNNKNTCIRKGTGNDFLLDKRTDGIISGEWQYFYIRQSHGYWEIGFQYTGEVIAYAYDEDVLNIGYFRVRSENRSWWRFYLPGLGRRISKQDIHNPGSYVWDFPKFYGDYFYLEFAVKAGRDASLVFSPTNSYGEDIYEIIIGAEDNLFVCFRRKRGEAPVIDKIYLDVLDADNYRYFWVAYKKGKLSFGRWGEETACFTYNDENPIDIRYFGITSEHVKSWWKFYLPCPEPLHVCEHQSLKLSCPNGLISLQGALYGRENKAYCYRDGLPEKKGCGDPDHSLEVLRKHCGGKQECTIDASNSIFDDPCVGTFKYLQVDYSCCYCD